MTTDKRDEDTLLGGSPRDFPSTCWSRFLSIRSEGADRGKALEALAASYWKPIYAYIRIGWAKTNEDAKDLTQDFFLWMMETDLPFRADPQKGRFRAYLKASLKNYLLGDDKRRRAQKRGGERRHFAIDEDAAAELPAHEGRDPERLMDEVWKNELILRALALLEKRLIQEGRADCFQVFRDYHLAGQEELNYRDVAVRYGLKEQDIDNHLRAAKKRLRGILMDLMAETVGSEEDLKQEWESLFGKGTP